MHRFVNLLPQLYYFWLSAKTRNFTHAAREAFVSQSAISRQIFLLEEKLGIKLFDRRKDGVLLTCKGEDLFRTCELIFRQLEEQTNTMTSGEPRGVLKISAPPGLGNTIVIDTVRRMLKEYPQITPALHSSSDIAMFNSWNTDITFSNFPINTSGFINLPVLCAKYCLAVSPGYKMANQKIRTPSDILGHTLISIDDSMNAWQTYLKLSHVDYHLGDLKHIVAGDASVAMNLAAEGAGVVLASDFILKDRIDAGSLVLLKAPQKGLCHLIFAIVREGFAADANIVAFLKLFKKTISKHNSNCALDTKTICGMIDDSIEGKRIDADEIIKGCPDLSSYAHEARAADTPA